MTDEEKLMLLRLQLYTASQQLKGDLLRQLRALLEEVLSTMDMGS